MTQNKENVRLLASLGVAGVLIVTIIWMLKEITSPREDLARSTQAVTSPATTTQPLITNRTSPMQARMSLGDKILVTADTTPEKQAGVQAFASGDYTTAQNKFQASLQTNRNDPEALIYLNNAKIGKSRAIKVVVSVPISSILNVSRETLRGVAQAQDEINQTGGINGVPLLLLIANDEGDVGIAQQLATEFVKDSSILAVVGNSRSDISIATGKIYNQGGLVMVAPTTQRAATGKYVFSVSPDSSVFALTLARHITQEAQRKNIAICGDSTSPLTKQSRQQYSDSIRQAGGNITNTVCDFGAPDFNPNAILGRAISDGAEGLVLLPRLDNIEPAINLARANRGRLGLFTYGGMYTIDTLKRGQRYFNGMVLPVFWHPDAVAGNAFTENATKLWGGRVNPRTATAYDSLQAIIAGLKQGNTRSELQVALSNPSFSALGATGTIQFSPEGDRKGTPFLVKIEPGSSSGTGYDFMLVQ